MKFDAINQQFFMAALFGLSMDVKLVYNIYWIIQTLQTCNLFIYMHAHLYMMLVYQFAVKFVGLGYMYACKSML